MYPAPSPSASPPASLSASLPNTLRQTEQRWLGFLQRLEARLDELGAMALPELEKTFTADPDPYHRGHGRLLAGFLGQIGHIREKASETYQEQVLDRRYQLIERFDVLSPERSLIDDFLHVCRAPYEERFSIACRQWEERLKQTGRIDAEAEYQHVLDEYEQLRQRFACSQCGAAIVIDKLYFVPALLACPFCQTQNTFRPSLRTQRLEQLGRQLAEQRTQPLLQAYHDAQARERKLYQRIAQLRLGQAPQGQIEALEQERQALIARTPALYEHYLRAMFDEWNAVVPDLKDANERFYRSQLAQFRASSGMDACASA